MGELRATRPRTREAEAEAAVVGRPAIAPAWDDGTARILALQRTAGNAAVTGMLGAPVVQRAPGDGTGDEEAAPGTTPATTTEPPTPDTTPAQGDGTAAPAPVTSPATAAPGATAAPAKKRKNVDLTGSHVLDAADEGDVPAPAEIAGLRAEWRELDARRKAAEGGGDEFSADDTARLAEVNRLLKLRHKSDAAETLEGNGYRDGSAAWYADVKQTTFLGQRIKVHRLLADRLDTAETAFLAAVQGQDEPEGGWVRSTSSLRGPTEGLHGLGLAIDLNPGTNPYLINPGRTSQRNTGEPIARSQGVRDVIDRAVLLVMNRTAEEEDFSAMPDLEDIAERVQASYTKLSDASDALRTYFTLTEEANGPQLDELVRTLGARDPRGRSAEQWRRTIRQDRDSLRTAARSKRWQRPTSGFIDLPWELVQALTDTGLSWLGDNTIGSGRDIMHFDMRTLGPVRRIFNSEKNRWTSLG